MNRLKDREFLLWIYSRLVNKHDESPDEDYMKRLLELIDNYGEKDD